MSFFNKVIDYVKGDHTAKIELVTGIYFMIAGVFLFIDIRFWETIGALSLFFFGLRIFLKSRKAE